MVHDKVSSKSFIYRNVKKKNGIIYGFVFFIFFYFFFQLVRMAPTIGDTDSIASDIAPLPNPPVYMPYSGTYNTSHGYQPIQYGHDRHISSGKQTNK